MVSYRLVFQKVDVALDFNNFALKGSTHLKLRRTEVFKPKKDENGGKYLLPIHLPMIGNPVYKRVLVNDTEVKSFVLKSVNGSVNSKVLEESCKSVDLMTFEGLHMAVQSLNDSIMYLEVNPSDPEIGLDIAFDFYDMTPMNSEVYFQKHWILPRASTNYREYRLFCSSKHSRLWFPTFLNSGFNYIKYEFNVTVPVQYNVVCGFPIQEDLSQRQVNQHMTTKTYKFSSQLYYPVQHTQPSSNNTKLNQHSSHTNSNSVNLGDKVESIELGNSVEYSVESGFGIFVGEFDFRDGLSVEKREEAEESESDEELAQLSSFSFEFEGNSRLTYVTLRGFGYLLDPTNVATRMCLETYKGVLGLDLPSVYLLFLPFGGFQENMDLSSCLRTQNYVDFRRCSSFTASENYLFSSFMDRMSQMYFGLYYRSGSNMVLFSLDVLHSFSDLTRDPSCVEKRIAIATGLSSLYVKRVQNPSKDLHLNLMLQSYLVEQYIKRNLGNTENKLRLWAKRELFATLVELLGDHYPLSTAQSNDTSQGGDGRGFVSEHLLMNDTVFLLKCQLIPSVLETILMNTNFLTESFIVHLFKYHLHYQLNNTVNHTQLNSNSVNIGDSVKLGDMGDKVKHSELDKSGVDGVEVGVLDAWEWLLNEVVVRYVMFWNSKPQNRLNKEKQLDINMAPEDILKRGVEHDQLNVCMTNLQNLIKSFVHGTGCPQISMGLILQLQRKGTSMDHLSFRIDINSLQPPLDINSEGQTKYTFVNITSQAAKNLYNIYTKLLQLTHYTQSQQPVNDEELVYKMVLRIFNVITTGVRDDVLDFGDLRDNIGLMSFSEIGLLRKKMCLFQAFFDPVDMIGRDGNFVMGFGYIGNYPWTFCLGYGPLWDCLEMLKVSCDVNKINDLLVDNGTNYCGTLIRSDYKLQYNPGQMPIGTSGGIPYWKMILVQQSLIQNDQKVNEDMSSKIFTLVLTI